MYLGSSGSGNIFGKEVAYNPQTVQGNVINLNISGDNSKEVIDNLQKLLSVSTRIEQPTITQSSILNNEDEKIKAKRNESSNAQKQIRSVLEEVNKIEKNTGTQIQEIRTEDIQISKNELLLKEYLLKGNEHYYNENILKL